MPIAGHQTVSPDSMDVLSLHLGVVMMAILLGIQLQALLQGVLQCFICCMAVGIVLELIYDQLEGRNVIPPMLDASIMSRLQGLVLDFLIVGAVSVVSVDGIIPQLPGAILICVVSLVFFAESLLPDYWFERGICEYGQTTGVISSGLILLKMCDPTTGFLLWRVSRSRTLQQCSSCSPGCRTPCPLPEHTVVGLLWLCPWGSSSST